MQRPTLLAGLDLVAPRLPDDALRLALQGGSQPLPHPREAFREVLESPAARASALSGAGPRSRVLVVLPPPASLVPMGHGHTLREALRALVELLTRRGVAHSRIRFLIASGLGHRPKMTELEPVLGLEVAGGHTVVVHDAEALRSLRPFDDGLGGTQELNAALLEADLVVNVSVRSRGSQPALSELVEGLATYRGLRALHEPGLTVEAERRRHDARAAALARALPLVSLAIVENAALLSPGLRSALGAEQGLSTSARTWNRLPDLARRRIVASWRSSRGAVAAYAGAPLEVEAQADARAGESWFIPAGPEADVLVIPVPDLSPDSPRGQSNPVLAAHLGLELLLPLARHRLRPGGAVVLVNPLHDQIDRALHLPYVDFYERALRLAPRGTELAERFELEFSGQPGLIAAYQRRGSVHPAHPFHRWYALERDRAGLKVYAAGAGVAAAQRVGLEPAESVESAIAQAAAEIGVASPRVAWLDLLGLGR